MKLTVRIEKNYGIEVVYPVCPQAVLFARIAGTKSLTRMTLQHIEALGYSFIVAQREHVTFSNFIPA